MNSTTKDALITFILTIVFVISIAIGSVLSSWISCSSKASVMQMEYNYGIISGCRIKPEKDFSLQNTRGQ